MDAETYKLLYTEWSAKVRMEYREKKCHRLKCESCPHMFPEPECPCINHCNCAKCVWLIKKGYSFKAYNDARLAKLAAASKQNKETY